MTSEREFFERIGEAIIKAQTEFYTSPHIPHYARHLGQVAWQAARQDWPSEDEAVEIMAKAITETAILECGKVKFIVNPLTTAATAYRALRNATQDRG